MSDAAVFLPPRNKSPKKMGDLSPELSPTLAAEVAELSNSLAVDDNPSKPVGPYDPDAFIAALRRQHASLILVKNRLKAENEKQREREIALQTREIAVGFRERRMAAYETLHKLRSHDGVERVPFRARLMMLLGG